MTERILEVNDLHVSFDITAGEVQAVRGVDFYLNKGEHWQLLVNQVQVNL